MLCVISVPPCEIVSLQRNHTHFLLTPHNEKDINPFMQFNSSAR